MEYFLIESLKWELLNSDYFNFHSSILLFKFLVQHKYGNILCWYNKVYFSAAIIVNESNFQHIF